MIEIDTDVRRLDIPAIHAFLSQCSHWARGIPLATVERAIHHSLCFGAYRAEAMLGFARVVTDRATYAWLCDVFVLEAHRGSGVATALMNSVVAHPDLCGLRRITLATSSAPGLYARHGFTPLATPAIWMERYTPDAYAPPA